MIVVDTHVLIWAVQNGPKLGQQAATIVEETAAIGTILIPAMCLWEVVMLDNRGRIELGRDVMSWIDATLDLPGMVLAPIDPKIAVDTVRLPDWLHRDPTDRMIVATARRHGATLMTADRVILDYAAKGHVQVIDARN